MENGNIAMCGLDCGSCAVFIATKNNDDILREETAKKWTARHRAKGNNRPPLKAQDINCQGCLSDGPIYVKCRACEIRKCGFQKGLKNCKECKDYRCEKLIELQKRFW